MFGQMPTALENHSSGSALINLGQKRLDSGFFFTNGGRFREAGGGDGWPKVIVGC